MNSIKQKIAQLKSYSINDLIKLNDKKYTLIENCKIFESNKFKKFRNKPIEKYNKVFVEHELILHIILIKIEYKNKLEHFFYQYAGQKFELSKKYLEYYKKRKTFNYSLDKKYIVSELIYQYDNSFVNYKKVRQNLNKLIEQKLNFKISSFIEFDLLLKLIARYILLEIKFNKKNLDMSIFIFWFKKIKFYILLENRHSSFLKFLKFSFTNFSHIKIKELLLNELEEVEDNLIKYVNKNAFNIIENIYFDLAEVFRLYPNEEKSQAYYKKEIDLILSYCNKFDIKDMSLSIFITKAIEISKNKILNGSYKLDELKKLFSQFSLDVNKNLKRMPKEEEIEKLYFNYYKDIKIDFKEMKSNDDILTYLSLNFTHFSFINDDILQEIENKRKKDSFPIRFLGTKINTSHYGRASIKNSNIISNDNIEKFYYHEHFSFHSHINNNILFDLDYEFNWSTKIEKEVIECINKLQIIEKPFKEQAILSIYAFNEKNYMTFCHLCLPIIENILRNYLNKIFGDTLSVKQTDTIQFKTLNEILNSIEHNENNYIDKGIIYYFKYILVEPDSLNFRNIILHGFMPENGFNKWNSMYILTVFLYLIVYFKNDEIEN